MLQYFDFEVKLKIDHDITYDFFKKNNNTSLFTSQSPSKSHQQPSNQWCFSFRPQLTYNKISFKFKKSTYYDFNRITYYKKIKKYKSRKINSKTGQSYMVMHIMFLIHFMKSNRTSVVKLLHVLLVSYWVLFYLLTFLIRSKFIYFNISKFWSRTSLDIY